MDAKVFKVALQMVEFGKCCAARAGSDSDLLAGFDVPYGPGFGFVHLRL